MIRKAAIVIPVVFLGLILTTFFMSFYSVTHIHRGMINEDLNATKKPDHIQLTWTDDPSTTQTITWRTNTSVKKCYIRYKKTEAASKKFNEVSVAAKEFTTVHGDIPGKMHIYSVTLTGLEPGRKYDYQVWSERAHPRKIYQFATGIKNTENFKVLIFGDSQSGNAGFPNYTPWRNTVHAAFEQNKDVNFMVNIGDIVENGQSYMHWNRWYDAAKGIIERVPNMVVQGNHENYGYKYNISKPFYFLEQFKVFQNGPEGLKGQVYSYDYGNAHFAVLNSQEFEEMHEATGILKTQAEWLDKDLAATQKPWKFVLFHKPPYYNKVGRVNELIREAFCPILDKYDVDVVFNGHDHCVSRTYPIRNDAFLNKDNKGVVYFITGRSGAKTYRDLKARGWDAFFYNPQDEPCYMALQVHGKRAAVTIRRLNGSVIDEYKINKETSKIAIHLMKR